MKMAQKLGGVPSASHNTIDRAGGQRFFFFVFFKKIYKKT
jgi:hypothetical protein